MEEKPSQVDISIEVGQGKSLGLKCVYVNAHSMYIFKIFRYGKVNIVSESSRFMDEMHAWNTTIKDHTMSCSRGKCFIERIG